MMGHCCALEALGDILKIVSVQIAQYFLIENGLAHSFICCLCGETKENKLVRFWCICRAE